MAGGGEVRSPIIPSSAGFSAHDHFRSLTPPELYLVTHSLTSASDTGNRFRLAIGPIQPSLFLVGRNLADGVQTDDMRLLKLMARARQR